MKKNWIKKATAFGLCAVMAAGLCACSSGTAQLDTDEVFASVEGDDSMDITMDVVNFMLRYSQAMYETYYMSYLGEDMWSQDASDDETYEENVKDTVSTSIEEMLVLKANAADYDVTITDEESEAIEAAAKQFMEDNTDEDGITAISASEDVVKQVLELYTYRTKMYNELVKDVDLEVTDEEALHKAMGYIHFEDDEEDDSSDDSAESTVTETRTAKEKADEFYQGLESGKDFKEYAEELGYDPVETAFNESTTSPNEDMIKAVWSLEEGEYTEIIETEDDGCYIALLTSDFDKEATEAEKDNIRDDRKSDAYTEAVSTLKEKTEVTMDTDLLDDIDFDDLGVTMYQEDTTEDTESTEDTDSEDTTEDTDSTDDTGSEDADSADDTGSEDTDSTDDTGSEDADSADDSE